MPAGSAQEIYLHPGEFAFSGERTRSRTILGSCVAVTFWHPEWKLGAMCHYMLPDRIRPAGEPLDGRYGEEVILFIADHFRHRKLHPVEFQVKLFGGSNMLPELVPQDGNSIGLKNVEAGKATLARAGFRILKADVGHCQHRAVIFDPGTGAVWVRRNAGKCEMRCLSKPDEGCPYDPAPPRQPGPKPAP